VSRPYPACSRYPQGWRPAAAAWLVARDISQRAEPDVRPLKPRGLCIYCGEDAPPATMLTDDVPSRHLMRPVLSAGKRRQGHPADGAPVQSVVKQCARAMQHTVLTIPCARSFPCTPRLYKILGVTAQEDCSNRRYQWLHPLCSWAHMSGLSTLVHATLAIKGEACNVTRQTHLDPSDLR
jgi:hypothetical protein